MLEAWVSQEAQHTDQKWLRAWSSSEHLLLPLLLLQLELACIQDGSLHRMLELALACPASGHTGPWRVVPWQLVRVCAGACFVADAALTRPGRFGAKGALAGVGQPAQGA